MFPNQVVVASQFTLVVVSSWVDVTNTATNYSSACALGFFHITPRDRKHIHRKPDPSFVSVESTALSTSANPRDEPDGIGTPRSTLEHE